MIYHWDIQQNTEEWMALRKGRFTASLIPKLFMKKTTDGYGDAIYKIATERLYGITPKGFSSEWTDRGHELEGEAINAYSIETLQTGKSVGFVEVDEWLGCSPDWVVGDDGLAQIKCLKWNNHLDCLLTGNVKKEYLLQVQVELWMTKRKWNDLYFYHPDYPSYKVRVTPNEEFFKQIEAEVDIAKQKVEETIEKLKQYEQV